MENTSDQKWQAFMDHVKKECLNHGVNLDLRDSKYIELSDSIKCGGYFEENPPTLALAAGHPEAKTLFLHEYGHMTQWLEKAPVWEGLGDSLEVLESWLSGEDAEDIETHVHRAKDLELDNEKRVVAMIKKWDLDIDSEEYTRKSNAYVLFYLYLLKSRKWSEPGNSPYTNQRVIESMSPRFDMDYENLDPKIEEIFREEGI